MKRLLSILILVAIPVQAQTPTQELLAHTEDLIAYIDSLEVQNANLRDWTGVVETDHKEAEKQIDELELTIESLRADLERVMDANASLTIQRDTLREYCSCKPILGRQGSMHSRRERLE